MAKQQEAKEQEAAGLPSEEADEDCCSVKDPCLRNSAATFGVGLSFFLENVNLPRNSLTDCFPW